MSDAYRVLVAQLHFLPENNTLVVMSDAPEIRAYTFPGDGKSIVKIDGLEEVDRNATTVSFLGGTYCI